MPNTRTKNKSKHPAAPVMTPRQLVSAGISKPRPRKQPTKDQRIAALEDELRAMQEQLQTEHLASIGGSPGITSASPDHDGDTEPATDDDEDYAPANSRKRTSRKPAGAGVRIKRCRAIDPFEPERVHSGATGLVDGWRSKLTSLSTSSPTMVSPYTSFTEESQPSPSPASRVPLVTPLTIMAMEDPRPVYLLPRFINRQKTYPGIKDLPSHIRMDFRNRFIRVIIRDIFNSERPWTNPDLETLQRVYDKVYPAYVARLRTNDAVFHPTITSIGVIRNRIGTAAVFAVQRHLANVFRQKRLQTIVARAKFVADQFKSDDDHPIIWRQYVVGDIANHHEIGGYKTTRRGVFQSEPILETLLVYYSSCGIMDATPVKDPGEGSRPIGALAMVAAAVERAYRLHLSGDYVGPTESFNTEFCGPRTELFMAYISKDLAEKHWDGIYRALAVVSKRVDQEVNDQVGASCAAHEHVPLPMSDPPSPPPMRAMSQEFTEPDP
ncbi:hypothetical protein BJ322DRAFT_1104702 [Thelephora terrestris]|uniref:Uncharacterized protein n=1 Tax=Thelephora terrestris TaxID=56493 RepID=A0A9P6LBT4_9AGAM|nr:hypothetical protein BJ322DRAFT_1104702 [Thelephora terrestris]